MKNTIEAALFMVGKGIRINELSSIVELPEKQVQEHLDILKEEYASRDSPIIITQQDDLIHMEVKHPYVEKVRALAPNMDLNRAVLKILSYIAYRQPIKQSVIVKKFGNRVYDYVKDLAKRGLIRAEPSGHTKRLTTTRKLVEYIGADDMSKLDTAIERARKEREATKEKPIGPVYKTRRRKKKEEAPQRDVTADEWMDKVKSDKRKKLHDHMDTFEKQTDEELSEEEDYEEVFELKGAKTEEED